MDKVRDSNVRPIRQWCGFVGGFRLSLHFAFQMALIAFATVTLKAVVSRADLEGALTSALFTGLAFAGLGLVTGELARRIVEEQVQTEFETWKSTHLSELSNAQDESSDANS